MLHCRRQNNPQCGALTSFLLAAFFILVFIVGVSLQRPVPKLPRPQSKEYYYNTEAAMLKLVNDISKRHLIMRPGESRVFRLTDNNLLVKRQSDARSSDGKPVAVYLVEGLLPGGSTAVGFRTQQLTIADLSPQTSQGDLRLGAWVEKNESI